MLVKIVGEDAVQSRADARGAELAFAVARIGTTRAMVVMGVWALLEKGMFVWLEPQVLLQFVRLFPHSYSGCIIVCCIILLHLASQRVVLQSCCIVSHHTVAPSKMLFLV